jgi:GMP synthase (glutamine-hydrolysing)
VRVLAITHQADAGPGVFADAVREAGATLETWLPPASPEPPRDPSGYDAVLTFGGAVHPDQGGEHPWLEAEKTLLAGLLELDVPLLAVCLGSELLAQAAGGAARRARAPEIGWYEVMTTPEGAGDPLIGPLAPRFSALEWHSYEIVLPAGAVSLARTAGCLQAYRVGSRAWGIQFHAEVTLADFELWLEDYRNDPDAVAFGPGPEALRVQTRAAIEDWNRLGRELCARFLAVAAPSSTLC